MDEPTTVILDDIRISITFLSFSNKYIDGRVETRLWDEMMELVSCFDILNDGGIELVLSLLAPQAIFLIDFTHH